MSALFIPDFAVPEEKIRYSIVAARCDGKWLCCRKAGRQTWEMPGGHREAGESPLEAAARELHEETGAVDFSLLPLDLYAYGPEEALHYGMLFLAEVTALGPLPEGTEMAEARLFDRPPAEQSYPALHPEWQRRAEEAVMPEFPLICRYISRDGWKRVLRKQRAMTEVEEGSFRGMACLLKLCKLREACVRRGVTIASDGSYWMQLAPAGGNWWLTVALSPEGKIWQYYFDLTAGNLLQGADSHFIDQYLDVVFSPAGEGVLLDAEELAAALMEGSIGEEAARQAREGAARLLREVPGRLDELEAYCLRLFARLREELKDCD